MFGIKIVHKPQVTFPKYTVFLDGVVIKVANSVEPSELLEILGVPHVYEIFIKNKE